MATPSPGGLSCCSCPQILDASPVFSIFLAVAWGPPVHIRSSGCPEQGWRCRRLGREGQSCACWFACDDIFVELVHSRLAAGWHIFLPQAAKHPHPIVWKSELMNPHMVRPKRKQSREHEGNQELVLCPAHAVEKEWVYSM
jgi:hypothetical protein